MQYLRLLLIPFSVFYGAIIWVRNWLYDTGVFQSRRFAMPVICIGNLAVGGAGKSPMAEYLIRLLKGGYKVAVLSRGYGRKTTGFRLVETGDSAAESGDEPLQFKTKFNDITVAVAEKRVHGLEQLESNHDLVILDDAFQHRAVQPSLSILIFDYHKLHDLRLMLPAGNLREPFASRKRAEILVVSKCPDELTEVQRSVVRSRIRPLSHQQLFFSTLSYGKLTPLGQGSERDLISLTPETTVLLITGIANPAPLLARIQACTPNVIHHNYLDHHPFSTKNITKLVVEFDSVAVADKIVVTTEKDAQRLKAPALLELLKGLPVYYLPVEAKFLGADAVQFNTLIKSHVTEHL
jgi:tetraacyldisaccharide 4'-kinase